MSTHLEPDILECEVNWALGSITMNKASGGNRNPVELFQILKDDAVCQSCTQYARKSGKLSSGHMIGKGQFSSQFQRQAMPKNVHNCTHLHASKIMFKILQARLQQYVNRELQMFNLDLEKAEELEIKLPTYVASSKKQESSKKIYFCFIDYTKAFDCVDHNTLWKILKEMGIPDHLTCLLGNLYAGQEAS